MDKDKNNPKNLCFKLFFSLANFFLDLIINIYFLDSPRRDEPIIQKQNGGKTNKGEKIQ